MNVRYQVGGDEFESAELFDDGDHRDGLAGDGYYGGTIPGGDARSRYGFYIEATDREGAVGIYPRDAPEEPFVFMIEGDVPEDIQYVFDLDNERELNGRPLHSNDLVNGTFVFEGREIYYNVGIRYRGSPWGRPSRQSYRMKFPKDDRWIRGRREINVSNRDRNDGLGYYLIGRNGTPEVPRARCGLLLHFDPRRRAPVRYPGCLRARQLGLHREVVRRRRGGQRHRAQGERAASIQRRRVSHRLGTRRRSSIWTSTPENYRFYYTHVHAPDAR